MECVMTTVLVMVLVRSTSSPSAVWQAKSCSSRLSQPLLTVSASMNHDVAHAAEGRGGGGMTGAQCSGVPGQSTPGAKHDEGEMQAQRATRAADGDRVGTAEYRGRRDRPRHRGWG